MGMRVTFNAAQLEVSIQNIANRASGNAARAMRRAAVRIRDLARAYAPYKTGSLESAIKDGITKDGRGRNVYFVYIDLDQIASNDSKFIGDYAFLMEEELHPFGRQKRKIRYDIDEGSKAKAKQNGKKVGGRFLSRAVREGTKDVIGDAVAEMRRVLNSTSLAGLSFQRETYSGEE